MPVKFRCFACSQLLGVSRAKVGSVVACPRCSAELIVPEPDGEPSPSGDEMGGHAPIVIPGLTVERTGSRSEGLPELEELGIDLRPEDIRAESGVLGTIPRRPISPPPPPVLELVELGSTSESEAIPAPEELPEIAVESLPFKAAWEERGPRARDVTIPRAAFMAWSLFALFALLLAFLAGLLVGRFGWRLPNAPQANNVRRADSEIATTAGCFSFRSTEMA